MADLRIVLDQLIAPVPGGVGRYTEELTRALIATAPRGSTVSGHISSIPASTRDAIVARLPGLSNLEMSPLDRRALALSWSYGIRIDGPTGLIHSPSPLAPLHRHDRSRTPKSQIAVTVHDVVPWTHPETLTRRGVAWHRRIIRRAERYADAIVVPTHSVARQLEEIFSIGDRVRVIPGAASASLAPPADAASRVARMNLPQRYVLAVGSLEPRKGMVDLVAAMSDPQLSGVPLVHVGPPAWGDVVLSTLAVEHGLEPSRITEVGRVDDADLATVLSRASVFVMPSLAEGFGLPLLEAMAAGVPTVHTDVPALDEVAAGAGVRVTRSGDDFRPRLAEAIQSILDDDGAAARLSLAGRDRARQFTWTDAAEKVWHLHADL